MDALEILLSIRDNPLPDDRKSLLQNLFLSPFEITFEEISAYSRSFADAYPLDHIKMLLRKGNIKSENPEVEIANSNLSEEEKLLMYLFFKGHIPLQIYENNKHPFIEGDAEYEQDYDAG